MCTLWQNPQQLLQAALQSPMCAFGPAASRTTADRLAASRRRAAAAGEGWRRDEAEWAAECEAGKQRVRCHRHAHAHVHTNANALMHMYTVRTRAGAHAHTLILAHTYWHTHSRTHTVLTHTC